jgi:hypothetical protein
VNKESFKMISYRMCPGQGEITQQKGQPIASSNQFYYLSPASLQSNPKGKNLSVSLFPVPQCGRLHGHRLVCLMRLLSTGELFLLPPGTFEKAR